MDKQGVLGPCAAIRPSKVGIAQCRYAGDTAAVESAGTPSRLPAARHAFDPREVRRILIGSYELRYEIAAQTNFILRLWHSRENRTLVREF